LEPTPARTPSYDTTPRRRSLLDREPSLDPDLDPPLSVEQAALVEREGRSVLLTVLRYLVLLLAALVVGALIWIVLADRAAAAMAAATTVSAPHVTPSRGVL